ncbi:hypothetical protein OUZ56_002000 [Daphnia magna]|uniref:Uncharacterized protein n=1 Tax=Daphnia magna TaxID=35525 RepID=A0ABR0A4V1_9CRUS|nr:hypothetical protein OUZ56_002000 [Daphnia magna]
MGHRTERSIGLSRSTLGASLNAKPAGLDPFFFPLSLSARCTQTVQLPSSQSCAAHHRLSPKLLFLQLSSFSPYESIPARACSFCSFVFLVPLAQAQSGVTRNEMLLDDLTDKKRSIRNDFCFRPAQFLYGWIDSFATRGLIAGRQANASQSKTNGDGNVANS